MAQFKNELESHAHSLETLNLLYQYDSFLDSLETIADFGCGSGLDIKWWAELMTRDDPPEPHNYKCYAVDRNLKFLKPEVKSLPNVFTFENDFDAGHVGIVPRKIDLLWSHNSFQYVTNPLHTLKMWHGDMNLDGMLIMMFPLSTYFEYNRLQNCSWSGAYFNYNIVNMMYMLAVNGFDCRDAYFKTTDDNTWLNVAVYKSEIKPMDPKTTTWYELADLGILNDSVVDCIQRFGYVKQEEIITSWLDKDFYQHKTKL
jgi:trans-aconitate methyltransferase